MTKPLMLTRNFAPLFLTQFFAAFNDNFLKNMLVFLIMARLSASEGASMVTLGGAIFMAPFLLLSAFGGQLADKFDKSIIAQRLKLAEVGAALVAAIGIIYASIPVLLGSLFLFGVGSALFGPIKYGILPDHLEKKDLPKANAWIEGATFIAIVAGTIAAGISFGTGENPYLLGSMVMIFAAMCYGVSLFIPKSGRADPDLVIDRNILRSTVKLIAELKDNARLLVTALMVSWFWFVGSIVLSILPPMIKLLGGTPTATTAYLTIFAVAIAVGSAIAAWFCAGRIVLLPAVFGTILLGLFSIDLSFAISGLQQSETVDGVFAFLAQPRALHVAFDLAMISISGAFLVVPTFAALQAWADASKRGRAVAANNVLNAAFITFGGLIVAGLQSIGAELSAVALILGVSSIAVGVLMFVKLPTNAIDDIVSVLFRAFHRVEIIGAENLEKAGDTPIFAPLHVSFLDAPLVKILTSKRPVFAVHSEIAKRWWLRPLLKPFNAMPLDPTKPMATRTLIRCVEQGQPLVIFPEGRITVTGSLMKVYDGAAMVADKTASNIVPIKIEGLEKTPFSRLNALQVKKQLFPKVTVKIMEPVQLAIPEDIKGRQRRQHAGAALYKIMSDLVYKSSNKDGTVVEEVIKAAKEFGMGKVILQDTVTGDLTYSRLLIGTRVLAEKIAKRFRDQQNIGVMLANSNGVVVSTLAVMSAGKTPAMINFTAGAANIDVALKAAQLRTVLTSRVFIKKAKLESLVEHMAKSVEIVYLEDVRETTTKLEKLKGMLLRTRPLVKKTASDPAVILYTSGSEGVPKGVVLTHKNILANASQASARIDFNSNDKVFNVLPMFHAFGLTAGTILPIVYGVPVYMFPKATDFRTVPEAIYSSNATIIFGTDAFLNGYARAAHPYDFQSIRYIFAGAAKVEDTTRALYANKFGKRILRGYGVTECAPVLALNTPMENKPGSVGKLLPGIEARYELEPGMGDRLLVRGDNIMAGYLRIENLGVIEPPPGGWHDTGDIVKVDEDGFITIIDRAKSFAKIGGEMVSTTAVTNVVNKLWQGVVSAAVNAPCPKKGEKIVVVTEYEQANRSDLIKFFKEQGMNELSIPSEVIITKVPLLASGKVDMVQVKKFINERGSDAAT